MSNFFVSGLGLLALALPLISASETGSALSGRVSEGYVPLPGAIVTVSSPGFLKSVTTDDSGRFVIESVPPGRYDFRTSAHGYAVFECPVIIHPNDSRRNRIDVTDLIPADRQTVSVFDLAVRKQARNRGHRAVTVSTRSGV